MQLQRVQYLPFHLLDHLEVCRPCQRRQDGRLQPDDRRPPQGVLTQQRQLPEPVADLQVPDLSFRTVEIYMYCISFSMLHTC